MITLITGGARSGKTRHALAMAGSTEPKIYIATAELLDDEMRWRAEVHREERGGRWETIEEPYEIAERLGKLRGVAVVDCLTIWLSNWLFRDESRIPEQIEKFSAALRTRKAEAIVITNEVGWSIVPDNPISRRFRDYSGFMNQRMAAAADRVYLMVCGIPLQVK